MPIGTLTKNTDAHPNQSVSTPPRTRAPAEQIGEPTTQQEETAEQQRVGVADPGEITLPQVEVGADRRHGDTDDGGVEDEHELGGGKKGEREPARTIGRVGAGRWRWQ